MANVMKMSVVYFWFGHFQTSKIDNKSRLEMRIGKFLFGSNLSNSRIMTYFFFWQVTKTVCTVQAPRPPGPARLLVSDFPHSGTTLLLARVTYTTLKLNFTLACYNTLHFTELRYPKLKLTALKLCRTPASQRDTREWR